jgi:cytochrome o ubiquinol oxidase subunit 2
VPRHDLVGEGPRRVLCVADADMAADPLAGRNLIGRFAGREFAAWNRMRSAALRWRNVQPGAVLKTSCLGRLGTLTALALAGLALSGCGVGVMQPRGPVGGANRTILVDSVIIMLAIVAPTIVAILAFAWHFRAANAKAEYKPTWAYSGRIELVVWGIPALVVMLLGGVAWIGAHQLDPAKPLVSQQPPLEIQVVSLDWKWLFLYPDAKIATVNSLTIPVGTPVHFSLTSASVMNAFFIPQLGSMIYTMNGMSTQLHLQADVAGTYYGQSSQFSGDGFADMNFQVGALPAAEFATWLQGASRSEKALDAGSYAELAKQSSKLPPATWRLADPDLYQAIVMQKVAPAPGPSLEGTKESSPASHGDHHVR